MFGVWFNSCLFEKIIGFTPKPDEVHELECNAVSFQEIDVGSEEIENTYDDPSYNVNEFEQTTSVLAIEHSVVNFNFEGIFIEEAGDSTTIHKERVQLDDWANMYKIETVAYESLLSILSGKFNTKNLQIDEFRNLDGVTMFTF